MLLLLKLDQASSISLEQEMCKSPELCFSMGWKRLGISSIDENDAEDGMERRRCRPG